MSGERPEQRVPMTRLRARVAERLVEAQQTAAILTTFNEVNMQPVMELRNRYKEKFEKKHGIKLGFMSFFVKAAVAALKKFPVVNASIDGSDIVYHGYFDIGIAVGSPRGLVVPVVRDADQLSFAEIEKQIVEFGSRAQDGKLTIEELTGGTFSISNGGVFGSMMSTPILNPPQSAILGMHKTYDRPIAENGQVVIRPMMYLALSYDHRIVDGREAVLFLVAIKEALEDPSTPAAGSLKPHVNISGGEFATCLGLQANARGLIWMLRSTLLPVSYSGFVASCCMHVRSGLPACCASWSGRNVSVASICGAPWGAARVF